MGINHWCVRVGHGGEYAGAARAGGFVAIAWHELGPLAWLRDAKDEGAAWSKFLAHYSKTYGVTGTAAGLGAGQVWRFIRDIKVGDIVATPNTPKGVVYFGRVTGEYEELNKSSGDVPYLQRHRVEWLRDVARRDLPQQLLGSIGARLTVSSLARAAPHIDAVIAGEGIDGRISASKKVDVIEHAISRLHGMHPKDFESFVAAYLQAIGYEARATQYTSDGGIDVEGSLDAEGLAEVMLRVQVKRTTSKVGNEVVLKTRGALAVGEQGAIISLGQFTHQAIEEAEQPGKMRIALVDGETFVEMLLAHWNELDDASKQLLGLKPKEELPVREKFVVVDE